MLNLSAQASPDGSEDHGNAVDAADRLMANDNALVDVLREMERERAHAAGAARSVVRALAVTLQARAGCTGDHADEVHDLSMAVGARLGLDHRVLDELAAVALLHDVGKIGIPDAVLHKAGPLDDAERELMHSHPTIGERILSAVPGLESVARAVRHAHERWDGAGYPDGLRGEEIPLASRIVLACDAWHALLGDRPYRSALGREAALEELRLCAGTQFDPSVVEALLAALADPAGLAVVASDPGALLATSGADSLDRELVALIAVASAVAGAHRLDDVLDVAAEAACIAIGAASLSIERWLPERSLLRTLINVGDLAPGEERRPVDEIYDVDGDGVLHSVLELGGTHFGSLDDPDLPPIERHLLRSLGKHCCVAVPIVFGDRAWGQIWASRKPGQPTFTARDARFLDALSVQISGAIGRAEVFSTVSDLAATDALTGLANRRAFDEGLELAHLEARRDGHDLAVAMLDVDNLKDINDHHGHEAGDAAIRAVGEALSAQVAELPGAVVCRIGGDEFCVLLPRADQSLAASVGTGVVKRLSEREPPVGVSCGVAVLPAGQGRSTDLLRAADAAQYAAKRAGRGRVFVSGLTGDDSIAHLLHEDARTERRALRDSSGADVGRLLTETLTQLDGSLAGAEPTDRLAAVLRRSGEAIDAARWGLSFARTGARPRTVSVAGRPGALRGSIRRGTFLRWADVDALRASHGVAADSGPVVAHADDARLDGDLRGRMRRKGVTQILVMSISGAWGDWIIEIAADDRSLSPSEVEPVLRLLAPEALRSDKAGPAPLGLVT